MPRVIVRSSRSHVLALVFTLTVVAIGTVAIRTAPEVAAAPMCGVTFDLPSGTSAELEPGATAIFSYSVAVTAAEVSSIQIQMFSGSTSGLNVSIQPESTSFAVAPTQRAETFPVSGSISVGVPESFGAGTYAVSGLGVLASCTVPARDGSTTVIQGRDGPRELTVRVVAPPVPTDTPEPPPTETPLPPPAICDPDLDLDGSVNLSASPGDVVSAQFQASIVARRISRADLRVESGDHGGMNVEIEPMQSSFTFDPRSPETLLRTFSGTIFIHVPQNQPPGSYAVSGLVAAATCQGLDVAGAPTTINARSSASSIAIDIEAPPPTATSTATSTPSPSATPSPTPSPSATATTTPTATTTSTSTPTVTATPRGTATAAPSVTPTSTVSPTSTATVTPTPRSIVQRLATPSATETTTPMTPTRTATPGTPTVSPTVRDQDQQAQVETATATETPTGVVVDIAAGDSMTMLEWNQNRQLILAEGEQGSVTRTLAGLLSALLVAGGAYGVWRSRAGAEG